MNDSTLQQVSSASPVFWETAAADPERIAVIVDGGGPTTYGELAAEANRVSNGLRSRGLKVGDKLAIVLSNRMEFLAVQLGALQIGLYVVPVNRHLTVPELAHILGDCGASAVIVDSATTEAVVNAVAVAGIDLDRVYALDNPSGLRPFTDLKGSSAPPSERVSGAMLFYSSGTTGRPKGILRPLPGVSPEADQRRIAIGSVAAGLTRDGTFLSVGPLYHAAPNQNLMMALQIGQTGIVSSGFDPEHVLDLIEEHRVTDSFLVPTMMHRLVSLPAERRTAADVSSLRCILHAGAICPVATKLAMIEWVGPVLVEYYGASESGSATIIDSEQWLAHRGSVGQARPGMSVRICNELGEPLPPGEVGLIHLRTGTVIEYLGDPEKTTSSYVDGHFVPGDLGYLDEDGWLFLCDRRTDMIISGGVNIYPAEIEAALLDYGAVVDAAVFGASDPEWGQSVVAVVEFVAGIDTEIVLAGLRSHCETRLAKFKIPRVFHVVEQLPRNAAGKLNKNRLRESYEANILT